jgi:hypothetical protein
MSNLLKFARAKDDQAFVWRIAAAMMVRAQETEFWDLPTNSRSLVNWTLNNPMIAPPEMVNHVSTSPAIAANVVMTGVAVDTSGVPDGDIQFVVNEKWSRVADAMFLSNQPVAKKQDNSASQN